MRPHPKSAVVLLATVVGSGFLAACGDDDGGGTVDVTLQEFAIGVSNSSAGAGDITFEATNDGPDDEHELVIVRTDLDATDLPTDDTGAVDENGEGIEIVDEIEEFPVGETQSLTVNLSAGSYVLICNIYDEDEDEAHYAEGMLAPFQVE